jgi:protease II
MATQKAVNKKVKSHLKADNKYARKEIKEHNALIKKINKAKK